ncbi:MAG TPA: His/Gly/Thr/Pro-type tRNA ligase C-terminal domain-containing protein, partial [Actinomycetes bacterium]|nr:His/Gly/Thr/Pro-type tRNA ligase C-terminal domain-containing protein [Actinomycetes bacterium]
PPLPGVGWALGVDRTMLALDAEGVTPPTTRRLDVFAVPIGDEARRLLFETVVALRRRGIAADLAYGSRGLKGAMRAADRSGAAYALVVGERDLQAGIAQLKDLSTGDQTAVALTELVDHLQERFP